MGKKENKVGDSNEADASMKDLWASSKQPQNQAFVNWFDGIKLNQILGAVEEEADEEDEKEEEDAEKGEEKEEDGENTAAAAGSSSKQPQNQAFVNWFDGIKLNQILGAVEEEADEEDEKEEEDAEKGEEKEEDREKTAAAAGSSSKQPQNQAFVNWFDGIKLNQILRAVEEEADEED